jgi:tol-pal system protein YbgF
MAMNSRSLNLLACSKWLVFWSLCVCMGIAHASLFEDDEARKAILDLRKRVEQSNAAIKGLAEENAQLRRALLDLQGQIESLKSELSQSRGAQEQSTRTQAELARTLSEFQIRQKDLVVGVEDRLRRFDPVKVSLDGVEFMAEPSEKRDYDAAMETFRKGDFAAAQLAMGAFVQRYRTSGYAASALFWLGNAQYAKKDYKDSMSSFQQLLKSWPNHPRAPEAMLAVSNVQIELKDLKGARKTMEDLVKAYSASEAALTARDRLSRLR